MCGDTVTAWDQVAKEGGDAHGLKSPAPLLKVVALAKTMVTTMTIWQAWTCPAWLAWPLPHRLAKRSRLSDLEISGGFAKAMLPGQPVGGGFFTVKNNGKTDDRLLSVTSPVSGEVQIHEMETKDNVMRMRQLKDGIAIAAGETVKLEPGNLHLMFQKVKTPFKQGDTVPVTLTFERA